MVVSYRLKAGFNNIDSIIGVNKSLLHKCRYNKKAACCAQHDAVVTTKLLGMKF